MTFLIINGPNLNLLGLREPDIYGRQDFRALEDFIRAACEEAGVGCELFQSNHEGAIVDAIQGAYGRWPSPPSRGTSPTYPSARASVRSPTRALPASKAISASASRATAGPSCISKTIWRGDKP